MEPDGWRNALGRTRRRTIARLASVFGASELTPELWEELERGLIEADVGAPLSREIVTQLQEQVRGGEVRTGEQVRTRLRDILLGRLLTVEDASQPLKPEVIVFIGVNGSGKTTSAARLAKRRLDGGQKVLLAAADTYRAAAVEQLQKWATELGVRVVSGQPGGDPGAVVYDACQAALASDADALIVDTSGRMHTEHNLMDELEKICRVAGKVIPEAPHQVLLVLDATTGQNGLAQAQAFREKIGVTGVVLAKLDSSAKGGVGFAVSQRLNLPILYVGTGEKASDLLPLDPAAFVEGLLARSAPDVGSNQAAG